MKNKIVNGFYGRKLIVAYIGNGKSTNRYHIPYILARKERFAIKTIWYHKSCIWEKLENVVYTKSIEDITNDKEIDLVIICTPNASHYYFAKYVLEAGKHCLVEKPFTISSQEAEILFYLAESRGLYLGCYQNRRFDSDFLTMKEVVRSGKMGELFEIETHFDYYRPEIPETCVMFDAADSLIYRNSCHSIDQMISLFGKPDKVSYDIRQLMGKGRMNDYYDIDFFYGNLKYSIKASYFRLKKRPAFVAYGKKGMFIKEKRDRQEIDLKRLYYPDGHKDFGVDAAEDFGKLCYMDEIGRYREEYIPSVSGDYGRIYDEAYEIIVNGRKPSITKEQIILQISILEDMINSLE